jgi:hypothetical protein
MGFPELGLFLSHSGRWAAARVMNMHHTDAKGKVTKKSGDTTVVRRAARVMDQLG